MIRWMLLILGGVLLGGIVHLATVIILPRTATQDAYARLTAIAPVNTVVALPAPTPEKAVMGPPEARPRSDRASRCRGNSGPRGPRPQ